MKTEYSCTSCKQYDNLNAYFCRICGNSVQFSDKARGRVAHTYSTDEKYCDCCGNKRHDGTSCNPVIKRKY